MKDTNVKDLDVLAERPIVLTGPPGALSGEVVLRNRGESRAIVRQLSLVAEDGPSEALASTHRVGSTVVRPHSEVSMPVVLSLDPATPPGEYTMALEVGGANVAASVIVVERIALRFDPSSVVVENRPGVIGKTVTVTNRGNVPLQFSDPGPVVLDDEKIMCRILRSAGRKVADDEVLTLDKAVGEFFRQGHEILAGIRPLRVRITNGPVSVPPLVTAPLSLAIEVPEGLDQRTRYLGSFPFYNADLGFMVVPRMGA